MYIGVDWAGGSDMTAITSKYPLYLRAGDRVKVAGEPNSHRTIVVRRLDAHSAEIKTVVRPSRGYAKHVRRRKSGAH